MLFEFLGRYKKEIIQLCKAKVLTAGGAKPTSALLDRGLPIFYDELIEVLRRTASVVTVTTHLVENELKAGDAAAHGKESLRLGYTISQVVHSYGAVCQAITEFVKTKSFSMTPAEFQDLNLCLDCAIAEAVTEFEKVKSANTSQSEIERLGFLMHEMRNSLAAASMAYQMIQKGHVGSAGVTSKLVHDAHERMRSLINSSLTEVRQRGLAVVARTSLRLIDVISEVEANEMIMDESTKIQLEIEVDPLIQLIADRDLIFSALSNLINNAIKFTKKPGKVSVRATESDGKILIEVEDECGGLQEPEIEKIFNPFIQRNANKTGMGLGLGLSRKAIELNLGTLTVRNLPGKGCIFTISLPKMSE